MKTKQKTFINILLADDDKDDQFFFAKALKEIPDSHRLSTVSDGEQLMDYLSENSGHLPDVLFLDLNMPRKNGHECLDEIKNNEKLRQIPVIIYSTSLTDAVADSLYQSGAHYYMRKRNFDVLAKCIQRALVSVMENSGQPPRDKFIL